MRYPHENGTFEDPLKRLIQAVSEQTKFTPEELAALEELDTDLTWKHINVGESVSIIRAKLADIYGAIDPESALRKTFPRQPPDTARFTDETYFANRPKGILYAHLMTRNGRTHLQRHLEDFEKSLIPPYAKALIAALKAEA